MRKRIFDQSVAVGPVRRPGPACSPALDGGAAGIAYGLRIAGSGGPWQLLLLILAGWISHREQEVIEYRSRESRAPTEARQETYPA
jgi:hypothetical protein